MDETSINPTSPIEKDRQIAKLWEELNRLKNDIASLERVIQAVDVRNSKQILKDASYQAELRGMEKEARQLIEDAAKDTKEERVAPI